MLVFKGMNPAKEQKKESKEDHAGSFLGVTNPCVALLSKDSTIVVGNLLFFRSGAGKVERGEA